jgi:hypothetical protein
MNANIKDKIRFTNFEYKKDKYYFIFISELKAYGIGHFFKEALSKALYISSENIEFITIAPDVFEQYNYDNLIIINSTEDKSNQRKAHDDFMFDISSSNYINNLIDNILKSQDELFLYMFESSEYMTLDKKENVTLIGPKANIVKRLNNKISLYDIFSDTVPMADYYVVNSYEELLHMSNKLFKKEEKLFISLEKSAAGANSMIAYNENEIINRFQNNTYDTFLITNFIEHICDPTTLGVVINEKEVFVSGIADQTMQGTSFKGSIYPSKINHKIKKEIIKQTRLVGLKMASLGYRGIFGCDYIVTSDEKVFFIETNPRKQGTTMEFCCAMKTQLPKGSPNLPELEFYAVTENNKAPRMKEPDFFNTNIYWGTYNEKIKNKLQTNSYLPQQRGEIEMFESVAKNKLIKEYMILEHIGQDYFVNEGSFLGRVVATGKSYKDIDDGINMGKKMLAFTIKNDLNFDIDNIDDKCKNCQLYQNYELEQTN